MPLRNVGSLLPYHSHVDPGTVVSALNHMIDEVNSGRTVFYDFYTEAEKKAQPTRSTRACSSFVANPERPSRSYPRAEAFPTSVPFMKAFPMP